MITGRQVKGGHLIRVKIVLTDRLLTK